MSALQKIFSLLHPPEIARLEAGIVPHTFAAEAVILREGERAQKLFLVTQGRVRIEKNYLGSPVPVAELEAGQLFGEMSFVENSGASATVVADLPSEIGVIDSAAVSALLAADPALAARFYHSLALMLSKRLRHTTQMIMPGVMSS